MPPTFLRTVRELTPRPTQTILAACGLRGEVDLLLCFSSDPCETMVELHVL